MKIKTVTIEISESGLTDFDEQVNAALAEGWHLVKREVLPGVRLGDRCYFAPHLHAELVQLDPEPEPEAQPVDPIEALNVVRAFCNDNKCKGCLLEDFCTRHLLDNEGPVDWVLPREVSEA